MKLTILGTGNATVTECYNTCFAVRMGERVLLVDAGGGNGILVQMEKAGLSLADVKDINNIIITAKTKLYQKLV